ncbi:MAG: hypothetical protein V3T21_05550 [Candidatus Margulisiibacteriota bacterium]
MKIYLMSSSGASGTARRAAPPALEKQYKKIRNKYSRDGVINFIWRKDTAFLRDYYITVKNIVHMIAAYGLDEEMIDAAQRITGLIKADKIDLKRSYRHFSFELTRIHPTELGILYEILPRDVAFKLFEHEYFVPNKQKMVVANKLLLCFSTAQQAADFLYDLWSKYPNQTDAILHRGPLSEDFAFRRYERSEFLREFALLKIPEIK